MIAPGAEGILKARLKGLRPADTVVVSLVGRVEVDNPQVRPERNVQYDWRWAKGLDIAMFINAAVDWRNTAMDIKQADPRYLCLWDIDSSRGAKILWQPVCVAGEAKTVEGLVLSCGWYWKMDFCNFHEEDNGVFIRHNKVLF
jgi:hypothetical protein